MCETVTVQPVGLPLSITKTVVVPLTIIYNDLSVTGITSTLFNTKLDTITLTTSVTPTVTHHSIETHWDSLQYTVVTYTKEHIVKAFTTTTHPTQLVTSEQVATQWVTRLRTLTDPTPILITKFPTQHVTLPITKTWQITSTVCAPSGW
ncbi:hypothetical protein E2C01_034592 [Portunus trituberculatus]|uniref:Uncharacterized protein n=1 Tax=Portunus trituberculatus TaxID=210409 RepID=A0A5B7F387_PORTR|nr:hypothetical protein [Portunus trituberculatus]